MEQGMPLVFPMLFAPNAYNELYCAVFEILDIKWAEMVFFFIIYLKFLFLQFLNCIFKEFILHGISRSFWAS